MNLSGSGRKHGWSRGWSRRHSENAVYTIIKYEKHHLIDQYENYING